MHSLKANYPILLIQNPHPQYTITIPNPISPTNHSPFPTTHIPLYDVFLIHVFYFKSYEFTCLLNLLEIVLI